MNYNAHYHASLLTRRHRLNRRQARHMERGMEHALKHVHEYGSREEAAADIYNSLMPQGVLGFVATVFFAGLIKWIAEKIANYIWENWRAAEEHETEMQSLRKAIEPFC